MDMATHTSIAGESHGQRSLAGYNHWVAKGQTRLSGFTFTFTMEACSLPDASIHGNFQARILEWLSFSSPRGLPSPGIEPGSPALQAELYPPEPQGSWGSRREPPKRVQV